MANVVFHPLLLTPMQNVVAIDCRAPEGDDLTVGMLVVEAGTTDEQVLITPPKGGDEFYMTLPKDVLNQGQRYVGFQIRAAIRPVS
jgi:hypothetical protein